MTPLVFDFPWPPTTNHLFASIGKRRVKTKTYRDYLADCIEATLTTRIPRFTADHKRLSVAIICHAPTKISYDLDNRAKALLDSVQACGIIGNDSQVDRLYLVRGIPKDGGSVNVTIAAIND